MTHIRGKLIEQSVGSAVGPAVGSAVMIGNFDGYHIGHQKLMQALLKAAEAKKLKPIVFTFNPHPVSFFSGKTFQTIYTSEEKAHLFAQTAVDTFLEYPFDKDVADMPPEAFVKAVLHGELKCRYAVVGEGYRFGVRQSGTDEDLRRIAAEYEIETEVVPAECVKGVKVSSTSIREHIRGRSFKEAAALLSRPYFVRGKVVVGKKLGRALGFPTANLEADVNKLLPPDGVYMTETIYNGITYKSMTNIGFNPTAGGTCRRVVETLLHGFDGELYGETIQVNFIKWMRNEIKYPSLDALVNQLKQDAQKSK